MYSTMRNWSTLAIIQYHYFIYFSFGSFGFGDFVTTDTRGEKSSKIYNSKNWFLASKFKPKLTNQLQELAWNAPEFGV